MPDSALLVKRYLGQNPALLSLVATAGSKPDGADFDDLDDHVLVGDLPERADPNSYNPFVLISAEGGIPHPEAPIPRDRVKVRVWAGINQHADARTVYEEVERWLHQKNGIDLSPDGVIVISQAVTRPQQLTDPDSGWATVVGYYEIMARPSSEAAPPTFTASFFSGAGAPDTLHHDGDIYLDETTGNLYEQVDGSWGSPVGTITGESQMPSLTYHKVSAASNNAHTIKASAGTVTGWKIYNNAEYPIYVKLYDLASTPDPSSNTPKQTIGVDAGLGDVSNSAGFTYTSGIGIAIVKGIADNDNSPVAADDCSVDLFYQ